MILVTGATGRVGYRLMEALADARADATAMVRVEAKAADLPGTARSRRRDAGRPAARAGAARVRPDLPAQPRDRGAGRARAGVHRRGGEGRAPAAHREALRGRLPGPRLRGAVHARPPAGRVPPGLGRPAGHVPGRGHLHGRSPRRGGGDPAHRRDQGVGRPRPGRVHRRHRRRPGRRPCPHHRRPRRRHVRADRAGSARLRRDRPPLLSRLRPEGGVRRPAGGTDARPAA